ncbi:MAG TPA: hypothetical protein VFB08_05060 [Burkholderiales bacterium]|nr:hypothetical protein [Burkholderiales bacterium]
MPRIALLAAFVLFLPLAARAAAPDEKENAAAGGSTPPAAEARIPAWSLLGFHGAWVAEYDVTPPPPVAVRLRHRAAPGDRHRRRPARQ